MAAVQRQENSILKLVLELGPLITFFLVNARAEGWELQRFGFFAAIAPGDIPIMAATAAFMMATVISLLVSLSLYRRVPVMPLVSGVIVIVFGGLTLYLQNELFIKLKPTIVNAIFATALLGGLAFGRSLLQFVFDSVIQLDADGWRKLTLRWGLFFILLAILNEVMWRNFSTDTWVAFKVFATMPLTVAFALSQLPMMQRHALKEG